MAFPDLDQVPAVETVASEADRISRAASSAGRAPVPRYPSHSVCDLITHLIVIYRWVTEIVNTRTRERLPQTPIDSSLWSVDETVLQFRNALESLLSQIAEADPSTEVWSFSSDHTIGFWQRRMAHETAMHRWDADSAVHTEPNPIPVSVAVSGLAEGLRIHVQRPLRRVEVAGQGELVLLRCIDVSYWATVQLLETGIHVADIPTRQHTPNATISGTASQLWLMMTGRIPIQTVASSGDQAALSMLERTLTLIPPAL